MSAVQSYSCNAYVGVGGIEFDIWKREYWIFAYTQYLLGGKIERMRTMPCICPTLIASGSIRMEAMSIRSQAINFPFFYLFLLFLLLIPFPVDATATWHHRSKSQIAQNKCTFLIKNNVNEKKQKNSINVCQSQWAAMAGEIRDDICSAHGRFSGSAFFSVAPISCSPNDWNWIHSIFFASSNIWMWVRARSRDRILFLRQFNFAYIRLFFLFVRCNYSQSQINLQQSASRNIYAGCCCTQYWRRAPTHSDTVFNLQCALKANKLENYTSTAR